MDELDPEEEAEDDFNARIDADSIDEYHRLKHSTSTLSLIPDQSYVGIRGQYFIARRLGIKDYWSENNYGNFADVDIHVRCRKYGTDRSIDVKASGGIYDPIYVKVPRSDVGYADYYVFVRWPDPLCPTWGFGPQIAEAPTIMWSYANHAVPRIWLKQAAWDDFKALVEPWPGSYKDKPWIGS